MTIISKDSKFGRQTENLHYLPFGRFRVDRDATGERAAILVGREGQRAFLIDALTGASRRGAYLITGRRGVGKSTFVENCLREFDANVFRRYLRGSTGRNLIDLLATLGIVVAFTLLCLIASDLIEFLAPLVQGNAIVAILITSAAVLTFLPVLYGKYVLDCLATSVSLRWNALISPVLFAGILAASVWVFHLGSPAYSMLLAVTVFVLFVPVAMITSPREFPLVSILGRFKKRHSVHAAVLARGMMQLVLPVFFLICLSWSINVAIQEWAVPTFSQSASLLMQDDYEGPLPYVVALADITKLLAMLAPVALLLMSAALGLSYFFPLAFGRGEPSDDASLDEQQALRVLTSLSLMLALAVFVTFILTFVVPDVTFGALSERGAQLALESGADWAFRGGVAALAIGVIIGIWLRTPALLVRLTPVALSWAFLIYLVWSYVPEPFVIALGTTFNENSDSINQQSIALLRASIVIVLLLSTAFTSSLLVETFAKPEQQRFLAPSLVFLLATTIAFAFALDRGSLDTLLATSVVSVLVCPLTALFLPTLQPKGAGNLADLVETRLRRRLVPPVEALLLFKAIACIGIGLQLSYPLVTLLPENLTPSVLAETAPDECILTSRTKCTGGHGIELSDYGKSIRWPTTLNRELLESREAAPFLADDASEQIGSVSGVDLQYRASVDLYTPFGSSFQDEGLWTLMLLLLALLLYFAEYEWIGRSFIAQRQVRSLDRGPRRGYLFHHDLDPAWLDASVKLPENLSSRQEELANRASRDLERQRKTRFRTLEAATFPYGIAKVWLPSLVVRVNLGFDHLDHRGVTHAMLFGLAGAYQRAFMSWRSPYKIVSSLFVIIIFLAAIAAAGRTVFDPPRYLTSIMGADLLAPAEAVGDAENQAIRPADLYCSWLSRVSDETGKQVFVPSMICEVAPESAGTILSVLFAPLIQVDLDIALSEPGDSFRPIFSLLHANNGLPELIAGAGSKQRPSDWVFKQKPSLTFRVYHIAMLFLLIWGMSYLSRRLPILPYRTIHGRIKTLMNDLVETRTERRSGGRFGLTRIVDSVFRNERQTEQSRDALDPRSVEIALMEVLEDIQAHNKLRLVVPMLTVSIPTPEVHFVFDELDKIGGVVDAEGTALGVGEADKQAVDSERQRTYELHALLSDMKRVISSAPARFIFVGGRALHDEWVRDVNRMGTRQPLLSSIFDAEIYLPSLLLDIPRSESQTGSTNRTASLDLRVRQYLGRIHEAAKTLDQELQLTRILPFFASPIRPQVAQDFDELSAVEDLEIDVIDARLGRRLSPGLPDLADKRDERSWLLSDLTDFLAFRSAGSPKRMRETLQQMIRPAGSYFKANDDSRFELVPDRDMVVIDRAELYRMQFVAYVFQHIDRTFGEVLLRRDDKVAINVFFLFDYLMKLHGRAFSLSSLERLDELAHIHRAPDLRRMLERVIEDSVEKFFHRMLNGLYSYRFQSDLAMEIRYLSRMSEPEMAALNFTLDESHELKTTYSAMLSASGQPSPDIISALGELYEFDQAYDVARSHYERAIVMIDTEFERQVGRFNTSGAEKQVASLPEAVSKLGSDLSGVRDTGVIDSILRGAREDKRVLGGYMPWAVRRLRLMLQIGLTFEQAGDEERAQAQYHSAHMLARAITDIAFRTAEERKMAIEDDPNRWDDRGWLKLLLENLTLVFQPLLASAWVSEKLEGSVDTSLAMVERELLDLSRRFTFIRQRGLTRNNLSDRAFDKDTQLPNVPVGDYGQNFALLSAEMHNKAGDLYFFKGRPVLSGGSVEDINNRIHSPKSRTYVQRIQELKGYLPMARYQYCTAMHEVRRFVKFRSDLGAGLLNPVKELGRPSTHRQANWPSIVHLTASSSLVDLGEMMRAGTTISAVLNATMQDGNTGNETLVEFQKNVAKLRALRRKRDNESINQRKAIRGRNKRLSRVLNANRPNLLDQNFLATLSAEFKEWCHAADDRVNKNTTAEAKNPRELLFSYLGKWREELDRTGKTGKKVIDERKIEIVFEPSRRDAVLLSFYFSIEGAKQTSLGGLPLAAADEYEIVLNDVGRLIKNILVLDALSVLPGATPSSGGFDLGAQNEDLIAILAETAQHVLEQIVELRNLKEQPVAQKRHEDGYRVGTDIPVSLANKTLGVILTLSKIVGKLNKGDRQRRVSEAVNALNAMIENWFGTCSETDQSKYDAYYDPSAEGNSQLARSRLLRMADRHMFPALAALEMRKTLIDDVLLGKASDMTDPEEIFNIYTKRHEEAGKWIEDLVEQNRLVDAPMHFTATKLAETLALADVLSPAHAAQDTSLTKKHLNQAEESFSMGRQYYKNISRLYYHFDDFNDRSRHSEHAASMMQADILAFFRARLDQ